MWWCGRLLVMVERLGWCLKDYSSVLSTKIFLSERTGILANQPAWAQKFPRKLMNEEKS